MSEKNNFDLEKNLERDLMNQAMKIVDEEVNNSEFLKTFYTSYFNEPDTMDCD